MNCKEIKIKKTGSVYLDLFSVPGGDIVGESDIPFSENIYLTCIISNRITNIRIDLDSHIPIILEENKDYYIEVRFNIATEIESNNIFKIIHKDESLTQYSIQFNSRNYVGILNLAIFGIFTPLIEVRSRKIDYLYEYNFMLKKISELGIDLTTRAKSFFEARAVLNEAIRTDENILSSQFSYLRSVILSGELEYLYFIFLRKPLKRIESEIVSHHSWETSSVNIDNYITQISKSSIQDSKGNVYPLELDSDCFQDSLNNVENQFLKYLIEYIINYIESTIDRLRKKNGFNILITELEECLSICESIYSAPIFRLISKLNYFPNKSNVLHHKYPYRDLYSLYWFLSQEINISDSIVSNSLKTPQKDLPKLYEYWCFLSIIELLNSRFKESDIIVQKLSRYNANNLCYIIDPQKSCLEYEVDDDKILKVYYNKDYSTENYIYQGRSYSHTLTPDISMELFIDSNLVALMHFDAKYKLENMDSFKNEDLDKMHTYKDGILGTIGAYVLYPGLKTQQYLQEEKNVKSLNEYFPSVGAFEYNLVDKSVLNSSEDQIVKMIENFVSIDRIVDCGNTFSSQAKSVDYLKRLLN